MELLRFVLFRERVVPQWLASIKDQYLSLHRKNDIRESTNTFDLLTHFSLNYVAFQCFSNRAIRWSFCGKKRPWHFRQRAKPFKCHTIREIGNWSVAVLFHLFVAHVCVHCLNVMWQTIRQRDIWLILCYYHSCSEGQTDETCTVVIFSYLLLYKVIFGRIPEPSTAIMWWGVVANTDNRAQHRSGHKFHY